jgi:hypothetical protein|tara:strand:- start:2566 stop:2775 length:210 start_codon:yes stop_codon:yes gene_type:complete
MNIEDVKRVLEGWDGTNMSDAQEIIEGYASGTEFTEEFVEHYLGKELYERLETMTIFFKKFESLKRDLH